MKTLHWSVVFILTVFYSVFWGEVFAESPMQTTRIIITANLEGRFETRDNGENEPLKVLARNLLAEKSRFPETIYLDAGNAYSPGFLSRFSRGSVIHSFFELTGNAGVAVNSRDLRISVDVLEFFQERKTVPLLSANILREKKTIFSTYTKVQNFGIISLSSPKSVFDAAETELFDLSLQDSEVSIRQAMEEAAQENISSFIVITGRSFQENLKLMRIFPQIKTWIAAADAAKGVFDTDVQKLSIESGSTLFFPVQSDGYYLLTLINNEPAEFEFKQPDAQIQENSLAYNRFVNRLNIWRQQLVEQQPRLFEPLTAGDNFSSENLMRNVRFQNRCDVGLADERSIANVSENSQVKIDVIEKLRDETFVFKCRLPGSKFTNLNLPSGTRLQGMSSNRINNRPLQPGRMYTLCATQRHLRELLPVRADIENCENSWMTYADYISNIWQPDSELEFNRVNDISEEILQSRMIGELNLQLSNFVESATVRRESLANTTPPGRPGASYLKWGLENTIEGKLYNAHHEFSLTPYLYYIRQDDLFLQNLLRFTFLYRYQWFSWMMPYAQSRYDSALVSDRGIRPALFRQTGGLSLNRNLLEGKIGLGYEKRIRDPATEPVFGLESQVKWELPILNALTYRLLWEAFFFRDFQIASEAVSVRSELTNRLSWNVLRFMSVSLSHRWFYFSDPGRSDLYSNQQFTVSVDLRDSFRYDF
ncbi:MAG: hypothetical protein KDK41_09800 [Leptospiraceae bacterium]|nr:hypothetical protein [Leptospiraceae bacterium]